MTLMDLKDKRIIIELDKNARQSFSKIAKSVQLSKQAVRLRVQNLEKKVIDGYYPMVNFSILGYSLYVVYFKIIGMPKKREEEFINKINQTQGIGLNVTIFGQWNINLAVWAKNAIDFEITLNNITKGFEQYIIKKTIMIESESHYFKFKLFKDLKNVAGTIVTKNKIKTITIDKTDEMILLELSKDARVNINQIAKNITLTPTAIAKRIKNLENKAVILGYKPQLNLDLLHVKVFLHLQKIDEKKEKQIIYYLSRIPEVVSVSKTFGNYELEFRAQVNNILELQKIIEDFKEKYSQEFIDFNLIIFVKFHKVLNYFPF